MALKAVHVSEVPNLDQIPENTSMTLISTGRVPSRVGFENGNGSLKKGKFAVIGHRGKGMNALTSPDGRFKAIKENSIRSFNEAARFPVDFVEFDVQVTKDGCPVLFHDNFIVTEENGTIIERRVTELCLEDFLSYGPQKDNKKLGKSLHRRTRDGRVICWDVVEDDYLCTLQEVFHHVDPRIGFNIELKFDDHIIYSEEDLTHCLKLILNIVLENSKERCIIFSSFQPDAAVLMRRLQSAYPVYFLTNGGNEVYPDIRRNSLDEAIKHCLANGLHGIVSEVRGIFRNPTLIPIMKESSLSLLTYGQLNNVPEAVYMQHLMGVDGVIVDLVMEITEVVSDFVNSAADVCVEDEIQKTKTAERPEFSQRELTFLLKLIPQLVKH